MGRSSSPSFRPPGPSARERELRVEGFDLVAGVDEVGRGPLAGPVVAAAVILPAHWPDPGVNDSKEHTAAEREALAPLIKATALAWGVASCDPEEIDRLNILRASLTAMRRAVEMLAPRPQHLIIDGNQLLAMEISQEARVGGDAENLCVAAASILAKVARDRVMVQAHRRYPAYNFAANKGYGTLEHRQALERLGPCPLHRKSFRPVSQMSLAFGDDA